MSMSRFHKSMLLLQYVHSGKSKKNMMLRFICAQHVFLALRGKFTFASIFGKRILPLRPWNYLSRLEQLGEISYGGLCRLFLLR